ncbi:hypothetical protein Tco_0237798 [Tanacetum coccineum]
MAAAAAVTSTRHPLFFLVSAATPRKPPPSSRHHHPTTHATTTATTVDVFVFNWQTTTYRKIRVDDDLHDLSYVEAEFPAIVINDDFAPQDALQYESQVSTPINNEIDFRISFDESDDEDYTIICDTDSFSYKMISVKNLKTDSENDYEKVIPSIPSPEPAISCFDDLDFFNDFVNEFPTIVYNIAQMSKSDLLTEPILNP